MKQKYKDALFIGMCALVVALSYCAIAYGIFTYCSTN